MKSTPSLCLAVLCTLSRSSAFQIHQMPATKSLVVSDHAYPFSSPSANPSCHAYNLMKSGIFMVSDSGNFFDDISDHGYDDDTDDEYSTSSERRISPTEAYAAMTDEEFEAHVPQINSVTLVGRIGQDPQPRYFDDGKVVLRLGLAVKRKYHPLERQVLNIKYGEEETDWYNLELWGRDAEYAEKYVTKGARVGVTGTLNMDAWQDRMTGEERTSVKVIVKHLDILETKAEADLRRSRQQGGGGYYNSSSDSDGGGRSGGNDYGYGSGGGGGASGFFDD